MVAATPYQATTRAHLRWIQERHLCTHLRFSSYSRQIVRVYAAHLQLQPELRSSRKCRIFLQANCQHIHRVPVTLSCIRFFSSICVSLAYPGIVSDAVFANMRSTAGPPVQQQSFLIYELHMYTDTQSLIPFWWCFRWFSFELDTQNEWTSSYFLFVFYNSASFVFCIAASRDM